MILPLDAETLQVSLVFIIYFTSLGFTRIMSHRFSCIGIVYLSRVALLSAVVLNISMAAIWL